MIELSQIKIGYQTLMDGLDKSLFIKEALGKRKYDTTAAERAYLKGIVGEKLGISDSDMRKFDIYKRSIDARDKACIRYVYSVRFISDDEDEILKKNKRNKNLKRIEKPVLYESRLSQLTDKNTGRIVVVGTGPAGLFAAYALALRGVKPVVIERGAAMEERIEDVRAFWEKEILNEDSNVAFGEGGAGTFSDGKLNSGVKDKDGSKRFILETFVRFGACRDILYDSKPHIGTDVLRNVIIAMRRAMIKQGVTFFFRTKMTGILKKDGHVTGILVEQEMTGKNTDTDSPFEEVTHEDVLECDRLILATGHSARDVFELLHDNEIPMCSKGFAIGVRVQHMQVDIDRAQYGENDGEHMLPAASYKLTGKTGDGRGVYTFCMCPGGYVVNASSESGHLVVNGMSDVDRDSGFANSAVVVSIEPGEDVFSGVELQRRLEYRMYEAANGHIPVQRYADFRAEVKGEPVKAPVKLNNNQPAVKGKWSYSDVAAALPDEISHAVVEAVDMFGKKIKGFDDGDTLILGLESRTSSPVRIIREDESLMSPALQGLYPCGEGAGYAGGILSAAMDGLRVAGRICDELI